MNWTKGISASYFMTIVDPETWLDTESVKITGGSIKKTVSGLRESATINTSGYNISKETWIRVYMIAKQGGGSERVPLFTGLASVPTDRRRGRVVSTTLECFSVLGHIDDVLLPRGWNAPVATNVLVLIRDLFKKVCKAPVYIEEVDEPPLLKDNAIVAEGGETYLTMIEKLLVVIEWRLKIGGDGTIYILPMAKDETVVFDSVGYDIIDTSSDIGYEFDSTSCPNVFRAVMNDSYAIAKDERDDSPYSIQNRGREVWVEESNVSLSDKETLSDYAIRRLKELQNTTQTISYDRRFVPDIYPSDILRLNYPAQDLVGMFLITTQDIELSYGAKVTEEVTKI